MEALSFGNNLITSINVLNNVNLTSLSCNNNKLTTIDISKNLKLKGFHCYKNLLKSIDISQNLELKSFWCGNNQFTSLDLKENLKLTEIRCNNNQIVNLDVSSQKDLIQLLAFNNQLESLNVKNGNNSKLYLEVYNNPNLTCIEVDDAAWSTANWTNIEATSTFVNNQTECTALSTEANNLDDFSLYPNPTTNKIIIKILEKSDLIIYSITGKEVSRKKLKIGQNKITNLNLSKGIYLFKVINKEKSSTKKVIVK